MRNRSSLLLFVLALTTAGPVGAQADPAAQQLEALARAALNARNHVIITGNEAEALQREPLAAQIRGAMSDQFARARTMRNASAEVGVTYPRATVEFVETEHEVNGEEAMLSAFVRNRRTIRSQAADAPAETIEGENYTFRFARQGGQWVVTSIRLHDTREKVAVPPADITYPPLAPDAVPVREGAPARNIDRNRPVQDRVRGAFESTGGIFRFTNWTPAAPATQTRYYHDQAVAYSYRWVWDYNPNYVRFSNDCTNFISQAVYAGGWPQVSGIKYFDSSWYHQLPEPSWTWGGAQNFFDFTKQSGRAFALQSYSEFIPGDLAQFRFPGQTNIHHTMIVSKTDNYGNVWVNYHSGPAQDKLLREFVATYEGGTLYGWGLWAWI